MTEETVVDPAFVDALSGAASRIAPDCVGITAPWKMSGGAVNEMWAFDIKKSDGSLTPLVLRRGAGGVRTYDDAVSVGTEAAAIMAAEARGVPVARIFGLLKSEDGLGEGFISERLDGETIGKRIVSLPSLAQARKGLAYQFGEVLAGIHKIDPADLDGLEVRTVRQFLNELERRYFALSVKRPVLALALRWLRDNRPEDGPLTVVHGDFRTGNLIVDEDGVRAVLDWEGVHLSDPMADLGFVCMNSWRFGEIDKPVGGVGQREDFFAGYTAAGGVLDKERVFYWQAFGAFRWGVMCAAMADGGILGASAVESALIARRASESEIDLLDLITAKEHC